MNTQLTARIHYARKRAKLTLADVAAALGLAKGSVHQWESGRASPSSTNLRKLAALLGVPLEWLGSDKSRLEDLDAPAESSPPSKPAALQLTPDEAELLRYFRRCSPEFRAALLASARALAAQSAATARKKSAS